MSTTTTTTTHPTSVVVVGAGVFGLSTALHFRRTCPDTKVTVVDRRLGNGMGAASDLNKIIRADYPDAFYTRLALEARESWRSDPIFKPHFHECGMLFAEEIGLGRDALDNYEKLGVQSVAETLTSEEARSRFPVFQDANWTGVPDGHYFNPQSGWGEADETVASVLKAATEEGVTFVEGIVCSLVLDDNKTCLGVKVSQEGAAEEDILADKTILCVGAYTAKLLADTAPDWDDLQVDGRMVAAGAVQCKATYPSEHEDKFKNAPVHFIGMWHTHGESIPPFKGYLKFNCEVSFTHLTHHTGLGRDISIPPSAETQSSFSQDVPAGLKQEVENVIKHTYGDYVPGIAPESYRMCWDAVSPNQDFIIDCHPKCQNLVIAAAGSFHAWKFFPNIGKYVVKKVLGTLEDEMSRKWAWDRDNDGAACEMYIPSRDMKAIGPFTGWKKE